MVDHNGEIPSQMTGTRGDEIMARAADDSSTVGPSCTSVGDWAWHKQVIGTRGWAPEAQGRFVCWICDASLTGNGAYDFTKLTHEQCTTASCSSNPNCLQAFGGHDGAICRELHCL